MRSTESYDGPALAALIAGACAIALAPIFVRFADVGSAATGFYRMFLAAVVLSPWLAAERRKHPGAGMSAAQWALMVVAGACFGADVLFFHAASRMTTVANATLFLNFAPIFVVLGARFLFGEAVRPALAAGLGIAMAGAAILMGNSVRLSMEHLQGDAFGLVAAVFYAGYLLGVSRLRNAARSTAEIMVWTSLFGAAVIVPFMLLSPEPALAGSTRGWLVLLALGAVSHAGGQSLIAYALAHLPVGFSGVALLVQPVAAAVFAWALLAEALGPLQLLGGAIVIAGVLVARRAAARKGHVEPAR